MSYSCVKFRFSSILFAEVISSKSFSTGKTVARRTESTWVSLMTNHFSSFRNTRVRWSAVSSRVLSLLSLPFPELEVSSLEFKHPWRVWKTRNVLQSQKALVRRAVAVETEEHARNWSFMIEPSSTVITNLSRLSRKTTSAITGLMLFTTKRTNAIQTLLDMTAASASLAVMAKTAHRKKPWRAKIFSSCKPRRRINTRGTSTCPGTT